MSPVLLLAAFAAVCLVAALLRGRHNPHHQPADHELHGAIEPPLVRVGVRDLLQHGTRVLDKVAVDNLDRFPHGIFTASILGWRAAYVVNDSHLTTVLQAKSKHRDFGWVPFFFLCNMGGLASKTVARLQSRDPKDADDAGFNADFHDLHVRELALGAPHQSVMAEFAAAWDPLLDSLRASVQAGSAGAEVDLWRWLRKAVAISVSRAAWGPRSPFSTDPALWEHFCTFADHYHPLKYMTSSVYAWRGVRARDAMVDAFERYYLDEAGSGRDSASRLSKARDRSLEKRGLSHREMARCAMSMCVGQFTPAAVTFDVIAYILSCPGLMDRIRHEVRSYIPLINTPDTTTNSRKPTIDITRASDTCPLLLSIVHEVLRLVTLGVTVRSVLHDHTLTLPLPTKGPSSPKATYRLRKGRLIWSSGLAIHGSPAHFPSPQTFDPERFLGCRFPETQVPGLFRVFGGVCLGRHIVRDVTTAAVASLISAFEFLPAAADGAPLCLPNLDRFTFDQGAAHPRGNTVARLRVGDGVSILWEGVQDWRRG
ncbi:cytochrome P450 [Podospora appendiculata]|uniref:Cytochrome P450 n=1 Tax=Podospora appendiculata TaxID=314037 RepID=A0AAE1CIC3_9PEZI|nr:cytochrome P450 [Podospora appendiculata]